MASRKWRQLAVELVTHARKLADGYRPFRFAEELLGGSVPHGDYCIAAARQYLAAEEKHDLWIACVQSAVAEVNANHAVVEEMIRKRDAGSKAAPTVIAEALARLQSLSQSGQRLKEIFSGRGYFNHAESD